MQNWINFWSLFFWLSIFGFILNPSSFISLVFYSEISWVSLYTLSVLFGSINDDINLTSLTFFILGFAGLEFSIVFLILILFKNFNLSLYFFDETKILNHFFDKSKNNISIDRFNWIS